MKNNPLQRTPTINLNKAGQAKASWSHLLLVRCKFQITDKKIKLLLKLTGFKKRTFKIKLLIKNGEVLEELEIFTIDLGFIWNLLFLNSKAFWYEFMKWGGGVR